MNLLIPMVLLGLVLILALVFSFTKVLNISGNNVTINGTLSLNGSVISPACSGHSYIVASDNNGTSWINLTAQGDDPYIICV